MTHDPVPRHPWWPRIPAAARFVLALNRGGRDPAPRRRSLQRAGTAYDIYEPAARAAGTIVFIHGMAAAGYRDQRVVDLSMALTAAGFRAVVPDIPSVRALRIQRHQPRAVQDLIGAIAADATLVPEGRCAVMAVSFSSAFALHAAGDPAIAPRLAALCLIGGYSDLDRVCRFLIRDDRADWYGFLLIARSYFTEVAPETPGFVAALERCIEASVEQDSNWDPASALDPGIKDEARLAALLRDPGRREAFAERVREAAAGDWRGYHVQLHLARVDLPVLMIHGRDDSVIPADESRHLAGHLAAHGVPHRLCITGLLTHGDSRLSFRALKEVIRIIASLAWFFAASAT